MASSESTVTYSYGATGMRELTVTESGGVTETTEHFWRGSTLTAERFSDGTVHEYVYGPGGLPLELVVRAPGQPAERYSYAVDGGGSVIGLTGDAPGEGLVVSYRYDPYGAVEETWAASGHEDLAERNPLRYRAYYHDAETGLYYLPARYYDPDTMRFLSPDPAPPGAEDPLSLNRYAYCVGDPVNASDPSGAITDVIGDGKLGSEDSITQTYIYMEPTDPGYASQRQQMVDAEVEAAARYAAERAVLGSVAVSAGGGGGGDLDWIGQVCVGWSEDDLRAVRSDFSGEGARVVIRTAYSLPPTSWVLIGAGLLLFYGGVQVATTGTTSYRRLDYAHSSSEVGNLKQSHLAYGMKCRYQPHEEENE